MTHSQELVARAKSGAIGLRTTGVQLQCLVVATRASRREELALAARDGGWATISCRDAQAARQCVQAMYLQLAVVDLSGPGGAIPDGMPELVEYLASVSDLLLVVCGHEGRPHEELWVRQLGSWLYLPGLEDASELGSLCGEARDLVERMAASSRLPLKPLRFAHE